MGHHAGEHPGLAAAQRHGVDPRIFDGLPARFQQLALLGIHRQRLVRADPEEGGVELARVMDEAAFELRGPRVERVQPPEIPPAVRREPRDPVAARREQLPQLTRRAHATWVAAAHPHDRDRLIHRARRRRHRAPPDPRLDLAQQERRQPHRVRVVEHERRRQTQPRHRAQTVAQLERPQRVEPELPERQPRIDRLAPRSAPARPPPARAPPPAPTASRSPAGTPASRRAKDPSPSLARRNGIRTRPRNSPGSAPACASARSAPPPKRAAATSARPVPCAASSSSRPSSADSAPTPIRSIRARSAAPRCAVMSLACSHHPTPPTRPPDPAHDDEPPAHPGTRSPPHSSPGPGCPTRPRSRRTTRTPAGPSRAVSSCRCHAASTFAAQHARPPAPPSASRPRRRPAPRRCAPRRSAGAPRRSDASSPASCSRSATSHASTLTCAPSSHQLSLQLGRTRRRRAPTADQQQAPHAVAHHQMPRDQATETASPTRDQHRAVAVEHRRVGGLGAIEPHHSRHEQQRPRAARPGAHRTPPPRPAPPTKPARHRHRPARTAPGSPTAPHAPTPTPAHPPGPPPRPRRRPRPASRTPAATPPYAHPPGTPATDRARPAPTPDANPGTPSPAPPRQSTSTAEGAGPPAAGR